MILPEQIDHVRFIASSLRWNLSLGNQFGRAVLPQLCAHGPIAPVSGGRES